MGEIPAGEVLVFVLILLVVVGMLLFYQRNSRAARYLMLGYLAVGAVCGILMYFDVPVNLLYVCWELRPPSSFIWCFFTSRLVR